MQAYIYGRKIKLLDNVKIHNAKLFKCYLENSNILTLISLLTVQHSVWLKIYISNQAKNKKV